jgi:hypothetical protein
MKRGLVSKDFDLCDHDRAIYCHVCAEENTTLKALIIRTVKSGLLCDPGCCGDDCVCDELREVAKGE